MRKERGYVSRAPKKGSGEGLPAGFLYARNLAFIRKFPETDTAKFEFAVYRMRTPAPLAACVSLNFKFRLTFLFDNLPSVHGWFSPSINSVLWKRLTSPSTCIISDYPYRCISFFGRLGDLTGLSYFPSGHTQHHHRISRFCLADFIDRSRNF